MPKEKGYIEFSRQYEGGPVSPPDTDHWLVAAAGQGNYLQVVGTHYFPLDGLADLSTISTLPDRNLLKWPRRCLVGISLHERGPDMITAAIAIEGLGIILLVAGFGEKIFLKKSNPAELLFQAGSFLLVLGSVLWVKIVLGS